MRYNVGASSKLRREGGRTRGRGGRRGGGCGKGKEKFGGRGEMEEWKGKGGGRMKA